ncbi:Hsp20/alpha crystallin family protein [Mesorhizobium sp.]|uniref:Hsp20/alpha crystallin family protein n=1 Tax=Mesorhizobium sp. TaxID=1871066 RepID=UPI000FE66F24|nr:Hsp20/alpha crystallin family protein [Mesorhizobium sp.]RWD86418.1 MAG: Hsp20/alpha crystallin family protein [Mesorhizobium sp.]TIV48642.1 MAG: Hsp20/alpha crystallin family protein [Mesorhizobium sp.]
MAIRDLIPWGREGSQLSDIYRDLHRGGDPFMMLHREMNRLFDDAMRGFETRMPSFGGAYAGQVWPSVEISDSETEIHVTAEIPGMDEKDIEVLLEDGVLTLRGEKRAETEDKGKQFSERFYGRFERRIPIGYEVEEDKVHASFRNGVLTVALPKTKRAQTKAKRIAVNEGKASSAKH